MQLKAPLTLPSPARGEGLLRRKPHQLRSLHGDSFSRGGLLPLPLRERIEVRGVVNFNCMVTAKSDRRLDRTTRKLAFRIPSP